MAATTYTKNDTREIFYGDHPDFDQEPVAVIAGGESRWSIWATRIYKHTETGEHWSVKIGRGKTEMQEDEVYEAPKRVELREQSTDAEIVTITLPVGAGQLADLMESQGHKEAAQALRGLVLVWMPVTEAA